jgi:membrane-bound serine protease (ClpP class)
VRRLAMAQMNRRSQRRVLAILCTMFGVVLLGFGGSASAQTGDTSADTTVKTAPVEVLQVSGFLDRIIANKIGKSIDAASARGAQALVLQIDSQGSVLSDADATALATRIKHSKIPVAIWVGQSGAKAFGHSGQLLAAATVNGMAPGTRIGRFGKPLVVDGEPLRFGEADARLVAGTLNSTDARSAGALKPANDQGVTAVLGEMIVALDGVTVNGVTLHTATDIVAKDGRSGRTTSGTTKLIKLGLFEGMMHTFASPPVAYLLTVLGLGLLLFEFFTAGVGVAGVAGALSLIAGCFGLASLPTRPIAVVLLVVAFVAFAVDVQTGVPRFWTGVGVVAFVLASLLMFRGVSLSWVALVFGIAGVLFAFLSGMPSMVRTRFATPTIGREFMIGRTGEALDAVAPEGVVLIGEGRWRARTNRATPVLKGGRVRVTGIDGLTLQVEPEEGGARDYRERRPKTVESVDSVPDLSQTEPK